jgi:uncharacterized membrane protein
VLKSSIRNSCTVFVVCASISWVSEHSLPSPLLSRHPVLFIVVMVVGMVVVHVYMSGDSQYSSMQMSRHFCT